MKAIWFLPFAYAAGAEGFALFVPYLVGVLLVLYFARAHRATPDLAPVAPSSIDIQPDVQPVIA